MERKQRSCALAVLTFVSLFSLLNSEACRSTGWNYDDEPCDEGYAEVYRDFDPYIVKTNRYCCNPESHWFKSVLREAGNCRVTECLGITEGDLCSTLDQRSINGSGIVLQYEEVMRDPCRQTDTRYPGVVALCCRPNSTESMLMTLLGAEENEYPHQAKLVLPGHCGGTIYNNRYVISAAHCVVSEEGEVEPVDEMQAVLGTNIATMESKEYIYKVKRVIVHPLYGGLATSKEWRMRGYGARIINDIALLELDRKIRFSENVKSLEIVSPGFNPFEHATSAVIVGWGTTDTLALSRYLHKANVELRTDQVCRGTWEDYYKDRKLTDKLLCVGGVLEGKWSPTAGAGDSGGPAICRQANGHPVLCGITSFGGDDELCALYNNETFCPPSVYTEVERFSKWIKDHAGPQNESTFHRPYLYGRNVERNEYPHQVHITSTTGKPCGGTLLAPDTVITAAQCVFLADREMHSGLQVTTGIHALNETGTTFGVLRAKHLSGFQRHGRPVNLTAQGQQILYTDKYHKNDLAVVKLDGNVSIDPKRLPELPTSGVNEFKEGVELSFPRNDSSFGGIMRAREFDILEESECQQRMNRLAKVRMNVKIGRNVFCGVEKYSGGSTCDRELGGGLLCRGTNGKEILCGVQIFRLCMFSIPNGFVNTALYTDWVQNAIQEMNSPEPPEEDKFAEVFRTIVSNIVLMFTSSALVMASN